MSIMMTVKHVICIGMNYGDGDYQLFTVSCLYNFSDEM